MVGLPLRAMNVPWSFLTVFSLVSYTESRCSPTSYYKNCWIRRFPGVFIDIEESQRRGAQLLKFYQEETALKCSRTCCLTRNFSCNLAIFHYDTAQENPNCFHLHCPTLESCILSLKGNVVLYNVTKGLDPDLLVFGKYFTSNVRVLPHHYGRVNISELLPSDKRQFIHPPQPAVKPLTTVPTVQPSSSARKVHRTVQQTTFQPKTVSTTTTGKTPLISGNHAQTTQTTSPTTSFTPHSPTIGTNLDHHNPETTPAYSSTNTETFPSITTLPQLANSPSTATTPMSDTESSQQANATKISLGRNHTTGSVGVQGVGGEDTIVELGPGWHVAAHTLLVAVAICVTVLLSCCCSVLLVASWRGQRKRMGRYRTSWRGKKASMRLIKYVLVRENS